MIAGTLLVLDEPTESPLESWFRGGRLPALEVRTTQTSFDDRPVQRGVAAASITNEQEVPEIATTVDGDSKSLITERREVSERMMIDWVADPTETGLIVASSIDGESPGDFPLDLFWDRCGSEPRLRHVDVESLHRAWNDEDALGDVWLNAADRGDGASIGYHADAATDHPATIGLGFKRPWSGTVMRGVIYESGYLALYSCDQPEDFVRFVEQELMPYFMEPGEEDGEGDGETCDGCGRESDTITDGLCIVCRDKRDEEQADDSQTTIEDLDTVHEGGEDGGD